jgi:hypothetical protein
MLLADGTGVVLGSRDQDRSHVERQLELHDGQVVRAANVETHALADELGERIARFGLAVNARRSFSPWNSPQSTSSRNPSCSIRNFDPVTVPVASRN